MGPRAPIGTARRGIRVSITAALAAAVVLSAAAPGWAAETYTVKRGDTLSHIAARYDVPGGWPALYRANRSVVGGNPHLIFPGQVLALDKVGTAKPKPKPDKPEAPDVSTSKVRPATGAVTSHYGMRTHPITGAYRMHNGTDFGYGDGRARAAKAGKVVSVAWVSGYGNLVTISHGGGVRTRYAHLAHATVGAGERVAAGELVGRIGSTGNATGAHLHFEVLVNGEFTNPLTWLRR